MTKRTLAGFLGWLVVAVLATGGSVAAVTAIGTGITGTGITGTAVEPLSSGQVDRELASSRPVPPRPSTSASPAPSGTTRGFSVAGGSVIASCAGSQVTLNSWSPAQGFRADHIEPGPDDKAGVRFRSEDREIRVEVRCAAGVPAMSTTVDD
jgi:hypothetical protein